MNLFGLPRYLGLVKHRTPAEAEAFVRLVSAAGYDPTAVGAVIEFESARSWSPQIRGPAHTFTTPPGYPVGLIQFSPDTAKRLGTSTAGLAKMSFLGQLPYVVAYYRQLWGPPAKFARSVDYYLAGWGDGVGAPLTYVLARKGDRKYAANPALANGKDTITVADLDSLVNGLINSATKAGVISVDLDARTLASVMAEYPNEPLVLTLERWRFEQ
jgi:hypothetical protein